VKFLKIALLLSLVTGPTAWPHAQLATTNQPPRLRTNASKLRGFSVTLVEGNLRTGAVAENMPLPAAKALADLKDFLPYRSFRLLDTQWTLGAGPIVGQLRGPDGKTYALQVASQLTPYDNTTESVTILKFLLTDTNPAIIDGGASNPPWNVAIPHELIDTSFRMNVGETVVVGTSRLQGDTALIVLLTAVANSSSAGR
jgi:hypothetical protein